METNCMYFMYTVLKHNDTSQTTLPLSLTPTFLFLFLLSFIFTMTYFQLS